MNPIYTIIEYILWFIAFVGIVATWILVSSFLILINRKQYDRKSN